MYFSKIKATGSCIPQKVVTNDELANIVETDDEWIKSRTGICQRHVSIGEDTSDLATGTAKMILEKGNINPEDIELIVVATISPDYNVPSVSCIVQKNIGAVNAMAFDISAACSGFVFGMSIADKFIKTGAFKNALVIGSEVLSKHVNWADRSTCVLFGDGSGGAFIERSEKPGVIAEDVMSDGAKGFSLTDARCTPSNAFNDVKKVESVEDIKIRMDGKEIFDFATRRIPKSIKKLMDENNITVDDIKYIVPHQANERIVKFIAKKLKMPVEKFYLNIYEYGNTSSASIPIALNEMFEKNLLEEGDKIIISGFGGGLTWGSMLIEI